MAPRLVCSRWIGCALALAAALPAQVPATVLQPLDRVAQDIVRSGRLAEARSVVAVLEQLGADDKLLAKSRAAIGQAMAKPAKPTGDGSQQASALRKAMTGLSAQLAKAAPADRTRIAAALLALDSTHAEAHAAFGRRLVDGRWADPLEERCAARRAVVRDRVARTLKQDFAIESKVTEHPLYAALGVAKVTELQCGPLRVVTEWPEPKARRAFRWALQGLALSRWLCGGDADAAPRGASYVHFGQRVLYQRAVEHLGSTAVIPDEEVRAVLPLQAFNLPDGTRLLQDNTEAAFATAMTYDDAYYRVRHPWLLAGHVDWVGRSLFGSPLGTYTFDEEAARSPGTVAGGIDAEREAMERLGKAGLAGARAYLRWLCERREDPPWTRAFVEEVGMIPAGAVVKCTFVHEYLVERELFAGLLAAPKDTVPFQDAVAAATVEPWDRFEETWRTWMLGGAAPGVLQRLAGAAVDALTEDEARGLAHLNRIRERAHAVQRYRSPKPPAVTFERSLADAARLHAKYLQLNPDQSGAWPDAHEEYVDRPGFTPEGSFAGLHSVIAGADNSVAAIDGWMGTFYHRLPLTDPGLLRTGFAIDGGIAVLDAGSICMPTNTHALFALWPPPGGTDVPLRFHPEMPNPVPGEDQSQWGYPVTFQHHLQPPHDPAGVRMTLRLGDAQGSVVDCWYSTPVAPTNPELSPADSYCLIPKAALAPKAAYTVVVEMPGRDPLSWSFRTGG